MRKDDFIGQQFCWFTGVVEDIADPEKINRVKVRCHGYHDEDTAKLKSADLPWAIVMMPNTSQASKGYGRTHELEVGSWVVGFFRDGSSSQDPLVMGSVSTMTDDTIDIPSEASSADNYPNNKVYKSMSGHTVEFDNGVWNEEVVEVIGVAAVTADDVRAAAFLDDENESDIPTPALVESDEVLAVAPVAAHRSGERIKVQHTNGTWIEIDENGNVMVDTLAIERTDDKVAGRITLSANNNIQLFTNGGDIDVNNMSGPININSRADKVNITAASDIVLSSVTKTRIM